ncbi:MAG: UDP-N-acetylglucosamine--N-acetylmuramyl-(pentapeptide) pyrophosphoryl-undecaprenol N-acetylglucosamine transferase [Candidatus Omnitrophota bacterium]
MKILVISGLSGGHVFPAVGFIDTLREKHKSIETLLVLPRGSVASQIGKLGYQMNYICFSSFKFRLDFKNIAAIFKFFQAILESLVILLTYKPDIVVGFGTLASVPMVIFAWMFRIDTLIHEQNVIPGRANRLLAIFSDRIAVSFIETKDYFKKYARKTVFTGNLLRRQLVRMDKQKALEFFGFSEDKFTILAMGGSQGSRKINLEFSRVISAIADKSKLQVIHLAGSQDFTLLEASYKDSGLNIRLFNFLEQMQYAYSASDLVISRGGATTIAEIIFFGLPAIIIPYPFAYKHQMANAKVLEEKGCVDIIDDNKLDGNLLRAHIENFIHNPQLLKFMRSRYDAFVKFDTHTLFIENALSLK